MELEGEVGSYASFVSRVGRASSELREIVGAEGGDSFMIEGGGGRGSNILESSMEESGEDVDMFDETTFVVVPGQSENVDNEVTLLADKTTLFIPPDEIQGFLRRTGINSRSRRKGFKVKKENGQCLCPTCEHPFSHRTSAIHQTYTHMNELELQKVNIYYQRCPHSPNKIFFNRKHYADHINSHEGIKNFKCQICHKGFGRKGDLERHILIHVNQGSQEVQTPFRHIPCYFCHKKFGSMWNLISHMCVHTKETPFKCSYCNKWFTHKSTMNSHIRQLHTHPDNPKPFSCPQCPRTWNERGRLTKHIKDVHGEKSHHCSTCSKSFSTKMNLDAHVDSVHRKIRHHCPHCPKTYSTKSTVYHHIRKEHNGN